MSQPKLQPVYKPAEQLKKEALEKMKLFSMLYHLLGHIPNELRSLDPEKIRKHLQKERPELNLSQREKAVDRLLNFISDLGLFFAFSDSPAPQAQLKAAPKPVPGAPNPAKQPALEPEAPMPEPAQPALNSPAPAMVPRYVRTPGLLFNNRLAPKPQPNKKPGLENEQPQPVKRKLPSPFLTLLKPY